MCKESKARAMNRNVGNACMGGATPEPQKGPNIQAFLHVCIVQRRVETSQGRAEIRPSGRKKVRAWLHYEQALTFRNEWDSEAHYHARVKARAYLQQYQNYY